MGERKGVGEDFDSFFFRTLPRLERLSTRILGRDPAAEDVAVEALARAYAHWDSLQRMEKPEAWVFRVATNLALDLIRRRRPLPAPGHDQAGPGGDDVALRLALIAALRHLTRRQQEVVVLRYIADLPENEVASALRMSLGTVKSHLHRAMPKLRDELGPTFVRSEVP
jgi:RNA polymerase sigma-70 factor (sigma-E family)